jgi:hypothetical protein
VLGTVIGAVVSAAALGYAQVTLPAQPLLSDYALVPGGMAPVLIGMLALAGACLSLAYGLATRAPSVTAAARVLLVAAAAGLILAAAFPTDPGLSEISSLEGEIHRWSVALVFTALPVAGWSLARRDAPRPGWNAVRALSVTSGLVLTAFLAAHPVSPVSALVNGAAYYDLLERGVALAEIALVAVMALASSGGSRQSAAKARQDTPVEAPVHAMNGRAAGVLNDRDGA